MQNHRMLCKLELMNFQLLVRSEQMLDDGKLLDETVEQVVRHVVHVELELELLLVLYIPKVQLFGLSVDAHYLRILLVAGQHELVNGIAFVVLHMNKVLRLQIQHLSSL